MEETFDKVSQVLIAYGLNILAAVVIFFVGKWIARRIKDILIGLMKKSNTEETLIQFAGNLAYASLMVFVCLAALAKLGIQTASFVAVLGAAGLAVGLALQGSLSNFAAGVLILLFRPYKVDDFIIAGGEAGTVKEIQIFNTVLASPDNVRIILPNSQATSSSIKNYTTNDTRRVDLIASISYGDDIAKAKQLLKEILDDCEYVLKDPEYKVAVQALADSSVNFVVRPWVKKEDYWNAYFSLTEQIKLIFDANDITIPFPQRDVHVHQEQSGSTTEAAKISAE